MKEFEQYIQKAVSAKNLSEFPQRRGYEYTVSFVTPEIGTAEGIYRTLLPCMVLNRETTIRAIPLGTTSHLESVSINAKDYMILRKAIEVSDHIVFPFVSYSLGPDNPLGPNIEEIRKINPKTKISYFIDFNYYFIPESYPFSNEYGKADKIAIIERNIAMVDQIIVTNKALYNFLGPELSTKEHIKGRGTDMVYQPLYFDKNLIPEDMARIVNPEKEKRFGFVLNNYHFSDINFIKGVLQDFMKEYSGKAQIVIIGFNGYHKGKNYLANINFEHHKTIPYFNYFETLNELAIDCFVIPAKPIPFNNTSKNYIKYLEFARLGVPVIAPNITPYSEIIEHNGNGVLCDKKETWTHQMKIFLEDPGKFEQQANMASATSLDFDINDKESIEKLMRIYEI